MVQFKTDGVLLALKYPLPCDLCGTTIFIDTPVYYICQDGHVRDKLRHRFVSKTELIFGG